MKLIDILIENNLQWPEGADGVVQDVNGEVKFYAGEKPRLSYGVWIRDESVDTVDICKIFYIQIASDYNTAIVTKQEWNHKIKKTMFADVKIGDNVWDSHKGWGVVDEVRYGSEYPIRVDFGHYYDSYTRDGYYSEYDTNPSLFWDEIEIKAPPKPLPKLDVDAKVIVWHNDGSKFRRHFSHFDKDGVLYAFIGGLTSFSGKGSTTAWDNWELAE